MERIFFELERNIEINNFIQWFIVTFICAVTCACINEYIFVKLFSIKTTKKQNVKIIVIETILRTLTAAIVPVSYYRTINVIWEIILYKKTLKQNIEKCILGAVINSITILCVEAVFSKLFCIGFDNINVYKEGLDNIKYKFCVIMSIFVCRLILCYIISKHNIKIRINDNLSKKGKNTVIIISIIGESLVFFNTIEMTMYITDFPFSIFVLDLVSLVVFFYMSIKDFIALTKLQEQDTKINNLEAYNKTLSIMYDNIRGFRHDYSNTIQALNGYAEIENIEGIKNMCKSMLQECKYVNNMGILDPNIIKNPGVYSILTTKYFLAEENNIKMNIEVMINLDNLEVSNYQLCKILAILLDNAIEAAKECEEKIINVKFIKDFRANRKLIIIENSYNEIDIDIDKIFTKGYTSKKDGQKQHGLGLWTVRKILCKSNNLNLFTTKRNELFCQQLEIYD